MRFNFQKLLDGILYIFLKAVRDNVASNDVTITSSLCNEMRMFGINFPVFLGTPAHIRIHFMFLYSSK